MQIKKTLTPDYYVLNAYSHFRLDFGRINHGEEGDRNTFIYRNKNYPGRIPESFWIRTQGKSNIFYNGTNFWKK